MTTYSLANLTAGDLAAGQDVLVAVLAYLAVIGESKGKR